jgi:hypothetical protein
MEKPKEINSSVLYKIQGVSVAFASPNETPMGTENRTKLHENRTRTNLRMNKNRKHDEKN